MNSGRTQRLAAAAAALAILGAAAPSAAQEPYSFTVTVLGGFGGSLDESDPGYGNSSYQLGFASVSESRVHLAARLGTIDFDAGDSLGGLFDANLDYATVGGEYRYQETFYTSGLFVALGGYRLEGVLLGLPEEETTVGLSAGVTGEVDLSRRVGIQGEVVAHWVLSDLVDFFVQALGGVALHF